MNGHAANKLKTDGLGPIQYTHIYIYKCYSIHTSINYFVNIKQIQHIFVVIVVVCKFVYFAFMSSSPILDISLLLACVRWETHKNNNKK